MLPSPELRGPTVCTEVAMQTSNVEVLWTARYDYEPGWTLSAHQHEFFQIIYCLGGRGTITIATDAHALGPGKLFLIEPSRPHGLSASAAVKTLDIKFRVHDAQLRRALLRVPAVWRHADEIVLHLLERIRHEGAQRQPFFRELCSTSLVEILVTLIRASRGVNLDKRYAADLPAGAVTDAIARRAVQYLHAHHAETLTMKRVSRVLGVSERHLRAKMEEALGQTPHRYLAEYRIDRAKDLIAHRGLALKDVATRTGFKTIHHFTRTFTQLAGVSPGVWRRLHANGIRRDVCIDPRFVNDLSPLAPSISDKPAAVLDKDSTPSQV
jgi:AraC-like DNA-binding protein/quercetin dioxygenase-like cupin family protein